MSRAFRVAHRSLRTRPEGWRMGGREDGPEKRSWWRRLLG